MSKIFNSFRDSLRTFALDCLRPTSKDMDYLSFQNMKNIREEICSLGAEFIKSGRYYILPEDGYIEADISHINNGFCGCFAFELSSALKSKYGIESEIIVKEYKGIPHEFLKIGNLYFDSESPCGVLDWKRLPIYL